VGENHRRGSSRSEPANGDNVVRSLHNGPKGNNPPPTTIELKTKMPRSFFAAFLFLIVCQCRAFGPTKVVRVAVSLRTKTTLRALCATVIQPDARSFTAWCFYFNHWSVPCVRATDMAQVAVSLRTKTTLRALCATVIQPDARSFIA